MSDTDATDKPDDERAELEEAVGENAGAEDADTGTDEVREEIEAGEAAAGVDEAAAEEAAGAQQAATTEDAEPESEMDWYILKVAFNREDSIRDALEKRVKMEGMEEYFGEIVVPTEDVVEFTRAGKRRVTKRKLLPGYLMVNMLINDDSWFLVRETSGISDFTGAAGKPMPMDPADIDRFIKKPKEDDEEDAPMKTAIPFKPGDRVRVKEGNFQNQEGEVDSIDEANGRVTVIINIFDRSVPMELDHWQIEDL